MRITCLAIGDELLRGESREGNSAVLAETLGRRGLRLGEVRILPDDFDAIAGALHGLCARPTLVVCSGGLGPTDDDFTRDAVARALGLEVVRDEAVLEGLRERYRRFGRPMHDSNARQADFPRGARVLRNDYGTAPGFVVDAGPNRIVCLPGVPREFRGVLTDHLDAILGGLDLPVRSRRETTLRLFGIAESDMQGVLGALPHYACVHLRSLPKYPEIRLKLGEGDDPAGYEACIAEARAALGWRVYGEGEDDSHAAAVLRALQAREATLAVAESCTGGLVGHLLTEVPGASRSLLADAVVYANEAKTAFVGVPEDLLARHGAVSEPVAAAMAEGVRARTGATVAVSTTGIAGPGGGSPDKPVGTVCIALASADGTRTLTHRFTGIDRWRFKQLVAHVALSEVRRWALGLAG